MRVVIFRERSFWLAQALEHDIGVQADDLKDLLARLDTAIAAEGVDLARLPPAPKYFQDLWPSRAGDFHPDPGQQSGMSGDWQFGVVA